MPFSNLNTSWSNLSQYYNKPFNNKPESPKLKYTTFDDGFIRGGLLNATLASVRDTERIGKFFLTGKGISFIVRQVGLQRSNPLLEQEDPNKKTPKKTPNQIYNLGLNTLAQIPVNAFGGHIIRQGVGLIGGGGFLEGDSLTNVKVKGYNYEKITSINAGLIANDELSGIDTALKNNRLLKYLSYYQGNPHPNDPRGRTYNSDDTYPMLLQEYNGGANSFYGIGKTQIFSTTLRTDFKSATANVGFLDGNQKFTPLTYQGLKLWFDTYRSRTSEGTLELLRSLRSFGFVPSFPKPADVDFSIYQGVSGSGLEAKEINTYITENIQSRLGTSTSKYGPNNIKSKYKVDSINVINIVNSSTFYGNSLEPNSSPAVSSYLNKGKNEVDGYFGRDIIKFRIEFLNNDNPILANATVGEAVNTDVLAFRAYIDEFSDGMNAKWNPYRYMGRGEEFYVYEGFTRDISVGFTIFAHSPEEMKPIYRKLNYLMSSFAPDYNAALKMRGNISYLTIGDYLYRQPGIFTDIKLSGMLDTHWEIALNNPEGGSDQGQYELPKHIKVNLSFKPIHTFLPRKVQANKYADAPFITIDKKAYPTQAKSTNKFLD